MDRIEQTISSVEVAETVGKAHNKLMRDIRITRTTMVTGKGQQYFINKLLAVM